MFRYRSIFAVLLCALLLLTGCQESGQSTAPETVQPEKVLTQPDPVTPEKPSVTPEPEKAEQPEETEQPEQTVLLGLQPGLPEIEVPAPNGLSYSAYFSRIRREYCLSGYYKDSDADVWDGYSVTLGSEARYPDGLNPDGLYLYRALSDYDTDEYYYPPEQYWQLLSSGVYDCAQTLRKVYYINADRTQLVQMNPDGSGSTVVYEAPMQSLCSIVGYENFLLLTQKQEDGTYCLLRYYEATDQFDTVITLPDGFGYQALSNHEFFIRMSNDRADELLAEHEWELWVEWHSEPAYDLESQKFDLERLREEFPKRHERTNFDSSVYILIQENYNEPQWFEGYYNTLTGYHRLMGYVWETRGYYFPDGTLWEKPYTATSDDTLFGSQFWMHLPSE